MSINRTFFFDYLRAQLFPRGFNPAQVAGLSAILDKWEREVPNADDRWLAYMLATVYHETGQTMQPVRETRAPTDDQAIVILNRFFLAGRLPWVKTPYWQRDREGKTWLGRGLVQITHRANYERISTAIHVDLVTDPNVALNMDVALNIMFVGMLNGLFTGKRLVDYFDGAKSDWRGARRIINGVESADRVAAYAQIFYPAVSYTVG